MKLSRNLAQKIHYFLDNILPPFLRDNVWFSTMVYWPVTRDKTKIFLNFKDRVVGLSNSEFAEAYAATAGLIDRPTDLGKRSFDYLIQSIEGATVLEVGTGSGLLAVTLAEKNSVTACDIHPPSSDVNKNSAVTWVSANAEDLPFDDRSFDIVVCTHTLEHVLDLSQAMRELRRVAREQIHIVVPMQRPYRFTPDLHIRFFPYEHSFLISIMPIQGEFRTRVLDGDLHYLEFVISKDKSAHD